MNYLMRGIGVLTAVGTISLLAFSLPPNEARGDSGDDLMPRLTHKAWQQECGSCHLAYPPTLLPKASWQGLMTGLDDHFGENASLDPATRTDILRFLEAHAAAAAHHRDRLVRAQARRGAGERVAAQVGRLGSQLRGLPPPGGTGQLRRRHREDSKISAHPAG